ncbi:unnamed protein product [Boreogadus saida]
MPCPFAVSRRSANAVRPATQMNPFHHHEWTSASQPASINLAPTLGQFNRAIVDLRYRSMTGRDLSPATTEIQPVGIRVAG